MKNHHLRRIPRGIVVSVAVAGAVLEIPIRSPGCGWSAAWVAESRRGMADYE